MEIFQIVMLCIVITILSVVLKMYKPEFSVQLVTITGVVVFILISGSLADVIELLKKYSAKVNIDIQYIKILLNILPVILMRMILQFMISFIII